MNDTAFISTRPIFKVDDEPRDALQDSLVGMVVNLPLNGCAHAELQLTNWGLTEGAEEPEFLYDDIGLGSEIEIQMPTDDATETIFRGDITGIEERYGEGSPTLVLLLQDKLHQLARLRHSRSFEDQSVDQLVQTIAQEAGLRADANVSAATAIWHQINESSLAFLLRVLGRFDIALRLTDNQLRARPEEPDPQPLELDAQDSALQVRLVADLNHQPTNTRVLGYNVATASEVDHEVSALSPAPADTTAAEALDQLSWSGEEVVPQPFARSDAEAQAFAEAHFNRRARRFVHGDVICLGEAALRSGREIELSGVSPRLRGTYRIVHCVHRFDNETGFETHLKVNRPDWSS